MKLFSSSIKSISDVMKGKEAYDAIYYLGSHRRDEG